jgi:hypothetical protein
MPLLDWNEYEFIEVLAVMPTVEEYGTHHRYHRVTPPLALTLTVYPYESVVCISLTLENGGLPVMQFAAYVRERIARESTRDDEWLELRDVIVAPNRFSYIEMGDPFDRTRYPLRHTLRIQVVPQISLVWQRH